MKDLSIENLFGDADLDMECPACQHNFTFKFNEVLSDRSIIICPQCQQEIEIVHDDTTKTTLANSTKALDDFNKSMKKLEQAFKKFGR